MAYPYRNRPDRSTTRPGVFARLAVLAFASMLPGAATWADRSEGPGVGDIPLDFGARSCPYPAQRIAVGGYADNTAAAQSVGALQRKAGEGARLRVCIAAAASQRHPDTGRRPGRVALSTCERSHVSRKRRNRKVRCP